MPATTLYRSTDIKVVRAGCTICQIGPKIVCLYLAVKSRFTNKNNKLTFTLNEIATYNKVPEQNIRGGLMVAVQQGFVDYNPSDDIFKITSKGLHYLSAFAGKRDFDDFLIPSIYGNSKDTTSNAT